MEDPNNITHKNPEANHREKSKFYYPELDGLRFIAFLLVFIHHAPVLNFSALRFIKDFGWIGVDLFFALSAFLFVKILAKEFEKTGTISISKFYIRRGLRIWPIYVLFCLFLVVVAVTRQVSVGVSLPFFPWRVLGLFTFTDNIFSAFKGYNPIPFSGQLWTISYEEQFYLVIPIMLRYLFKSRGSRVVLLLSALAVLFFIIRSVLIYQKTPHPAIWVLPMTHFESILLGIVVGLGGYEKLLSKVPAFLVLMVGLFAGWCMTLLGNVDSINWSLMV
jgi:peptidoglycan/LPS O-acetylase OafA/YrhL